MFLPSPSCKVIDFADQSDQIKEGNELT
jgi:hypothetical protein